MAVGPTRVAVVTDSTADLPNELAEQVGLRVVPMSVAFGTDTEISRVTISDEDFYARLDTAVDLPTTSQPNPHWFVEAWQDVADDGLDAVVSLHVSGDLSGTVAQARRLAPEAAVAVTVVDSRQVAGGLALMAVAAQHAADAGGSSDEVVAAAEAVGDVVVTRMVVDTMEYLRRGGRVSGMQATLGRALRVRPVLGVLDGRIQPHGRARTMRAGIDKVVDDMVEQFGDTPLALVVTHAVAPDAAATALSLARRRLAVVESVTTVFGPVLGTHTGPGAVALAAAPAVLVGSLPTTPARRA